MTTLAETMERARQAWEKTCDQMSLLDDGLAGSDGADGLSPSSSGDGDQGSNPQKAGVPVGAVAFLVRNGEDALPLDSMRTGKAAGSLDGITRGLPLGGDCTC